MITIDMKTLLEDKDFMERVYNETVALVEDHLDGKIDTAVKSVVNEGIKDRIDLQVNNRLAEIIEEGLDKEFEEINEWGQTKSKFTIKQRIVELFKENAVFQNRSHHSDRNLFTRQLENIWADWVKEYKSEFNKLIDRQFLQECHDHAVKILKEKLKLKV